MTSESLRKLEKGEVIEVIEGPTEEGESRRVKAIAMKDDLEGYITVSGNGGTTFLQEGGRLFKVVKETVMTDNFDLDEAPIKGDVEPKEVGKVEPGKVTSTARKLKVGEVVEVREYPR